MIRPLFFSPSFIFFFFFFLNDPAPPEISPLPLHDPLPIFWRQPRSRRPGIPLRPPPPLRCRVAARASPRRPSRRARPRRARRRACSPCTSRRNARSEEHTSELQSLAYLVCRLLLEKKKK